MVGWSDTRKAFLTFALNSFIELEVQPGRARIPVPFDPGTFFRYSFGITVHGGKVAQVL